jgi:hypothetical protein
MTSLFLYELTLSRRFRSAFVDVLQPVDRLAAVAVSVAYDHEDAAIGAGASCFAVDDRLADFEFVGHRLSVWKKLTR